jgi:hypothetical protein
MKLPKKYSIMKYAFGNYHPTFGTVQIGMESFLKITPNQIKSYNILECLFIFVKHYAKGEKIKIIKTKDYDDR